MDTIEILRQIERANGKFPRAAVEAAVSHQEEIVPELLRIMDDTVSRAAELDAEGGYMAHLYAMFLLAQFREVRAYPHLIRFASLPGDLLHSLCGDFLTEDFGRVLASVCGGELGGIQSIVESAEADEWIRGAALSALITLVAEGQESREAVVRYFAQLFRGQLERRPSDVWNSLVACSSDLYAAELIVDIQQAYQEDLVDPGNISIQDVKRDIALGMDRVLARLTEDRHHRMVRDTIKEMEWWACFGSDRQKETRLAPSASSALAQRINSKIGRNEPCPCGSGKKYKKCCLGKDAANLNELSSAKPDLYKPAALCIAGDSHVPAVVCEDEADKKCLFILARASRQMDALEAAEEADADLALTPGSGIGEVGPDCLRYLYKIGYRIMPGLNVEHVALLEDLDADEDLDFDEDGADDAIELLHRAAEEQIRSGNPPEVRQTLVRLAVPVIPEATSWK